jgi:hypothetical protein
MAATGTGSLSLRKIDVENSKPIAIGFKKIVFSHKATAGDTGINLLALVTPPEMSGTGFVQPTANELTAAQLLFYRKNLKLTSSSRGELMDYLSYSVASSTRINFNGFTAESGEIFIGVVDQQATTGIQVVDASPLVATGTLVAGTQDFTTGSAFQINKYPTTQIGNVIVYVDGVQQFRNTGNAVAAPSADGNYQEIDNGSGLGSIIRFNTTEAYDRNISVVSNGLLVNKPSASRDQTLESLAGQIDAMIPDLALATGNPTTTYQAAPNNVDIKTFGDSVQKLQRYRLVAANTTAVGPVDLVLCNTTGGAFTLTLPSAPNVGDMVEVWDSHGTFATFNLTVGRNSLLIEGAASDFVGNVNNMRVKFVYVSSARGWIVGDLT